MIITLLKAIHIMALLLWTAGLLSLPLMLARHEEGEHQFRYARIRKFTHYSYTRLVTPAAVIAIAAGTPLIFLRGMFVPWLFAKLALVAMLVALHAFVGHIVLKMGEEAGEQQPPPAWPMMTGLCVLILGILILVLLKPPLDVQQLPDLLRAPVGRQLPLEEVPN
ncbi:CopD family protein [Sphingomonas sp. 179-I 2A4 NHS]